MFIFFIGALLRGFHCNHFHRVKYVVIGRCFVFGFEMENQGFF